MAESSTPSVRMGELDTDFCSALDLQHEQVIDRGMCGEIVLVRKEDYKLVVKKFSLLDEQRKAKNVKAFYAEVHFMQKLSHPFVMKCIIAAQCPEYMAICMDYLKTGTLHNHLGNVSLELAELCVTQTACALRYLHKNNVVHLDVKLDNIFLDSEFNAILGDFGLAIRMEPNQKTVLRRQCGGTLGYFAPEVIAAPLDKQLDPYKMDTYCLGVSLWALALERFPEHNINYYSEARRRRDMPTNMRRWLLKLLDRDPTRRPTVTDFLTRLRREGAYRSVIDNN